MTATPQENKKRLAAGPAMPTREEALAGQSIAWAMERSARIGRCDLTTTTNCETYAGQLHSLHSIGQHMTRASTVGMQVKTCARCIWYLGR